MYITKLALENFRIYPELQLEFPMGLTIIVGPNASGKTALLEAIYVLATTKSPRTRIDRQMVRWGEAYSRLHGEFVSAQEGTTEISVVLPGAGAGEDGSGPDGKRIKVNGTSIERVADVIGRVAVVIFTTEDVAVVKGSPGNRRRFLNVAIAQLRPRYLDDVQRYRRALGQRNEVLKQIRQGDTARHTLDAWNQQLLDAGARLAMDRREFVDTLNQAAGPLHGELTDKDERLALTYEGDLAEAEDEQNARRCFEELLARHEDRDVALGYSSVGPHRDDLGMTANETPLRKYGSQGQQRTAALSLKLAQAEVVMSWRGEPPLVLLDDCLSELDERRSRHVLELAGKLQGLIITSPVLTELLAAQDGELLRVSDGRIEQ